MTRESDVRHRISLIAFLLGVGLLWPFPLGAALLMVGATFVLAISWEEKLAVLAVTREASPGPRATPGEDLQERGGSRRAV